VGAGSLTLGIAAAVAPGEVLGVDLQAGVIERQAEDVDEQRACGGRVLGDNGDAGDDRDAHGLAA
jgi:tRNA A58 N-methylase Trm61